MRVDITVFDDHGTTFIGSADLHPSSGTVNTAARARKQRTPKPQRTGPAAGLTDHVLALRDKGFFAAPKTAGEVHAELQPTYHCDLNRVQVTLLRLQRRKELRKTSKTVGGKSQVAYVW